MTVLAASLGPWQEQGWELSPGHYLSQAVIKMSVSLHHTPILFPLHRMLQPSIMFLTHISFLFRPLLLCLIPTGGAWSIH